MQATVKQQIVSVDNIRGAIAAKIDAGAFSSWISPLKFDVFDGVLTLGAVNQFSADYINSVYYGVLSDVASDFGLGLKISVCGATKTNTKIANDNNTQTYAPITTDDETARIAFDDFVLSDANAFAVSAARRVANGSVSFSPLFIYGPAGCGKTLLANCIKAASGCRVVMMSGAAFVSEFTRSLTTHNIFAFKDFCRNCDTFILDNIQALAGKRATLDEFMQLVLDLRESGKNVVLTSTQSPNNLTGFDRRMQSLLASGLPVDMVSPDENVRRVMLMRGGLDTQTAGYIAKHTPADGHAISGVINKIKTYTELMGTNVDMETASRLLADTLQKNKTPIAMVRGMCEKLGVSYEAICGSGRTRAIVLARQIMMVVLKNVTGLSLAEIGNMVGGRDHATVVYAIRQIEKLQKSDLMLSAQINQLVDEYK